MNKLRKNISTYRSITIVAGFLIATIAIYVAISSILQAMSPRSVQPQSNNPSIILTSSGTTLSGWVTFYSSPDNDPPDSRIISYPGQPSGHAEAGGTGTYDDPQTFASAHPNVYPIGTKIYVPRLQRYYIMEDLCACSHGPNHVDLWLEPSGTNAQILTCERTLTTNKKEETIIKDPDPDQPVDLTPLLSDGVCRAP